MLTASMVSGHCSKITDNDNYIQFPLVSVMRHKDQRSVTVAGLHSACNWLTATET